MHISTTAWTFMTMSILCLPDDGKLHKAVNANDRMHIIEEMTLFPDPQPVQHIELDPQRVNHISCYYYYYY